MQDGFAWPIIDVEPGTTYEVEVTVTSGSTTALRTLTHTTRALPGPAGSATVNVPAGSSAAQIAAAINGAAAGAVIVLANGTYNLSGTIALTSGGTSSAPKYVRGASRAGVILARSTVGSFFRTDGAVSDLIIEDMTFQGNGVDQPGGATSYTTIFDTSSATNAITRVTIRRTTATGIDRGVYMYNARQMLVYDNRWTGNNRWQRSPVDFLESNRTWDDDGINLAGVGNCAFNNSLTGFGDTCSMSQDGGSHGIGIHFYRNDIRNSGDDCVEADNARRNISFYDNRVHNAMNAGSIDPVYGGPYLHARNIVINTYRVNTYKWNSSTTGHFVYNNTVVCTVSGGPFDADVAGWYQPGGRAFRSYGFRNNLHVYRGNGITLWMDAETNDPLDWTHNSWFPNRPIQFQNAYYDNGLAQIQTSISNRTPVFSGTNRPFLNDNITTNNPWTTTVTLGATAASEVTATYTPTLAAGVSPKNSGVAIPNITDGFSGASPDRGAVIAGRPATSYGDRS